MQNLKHLLNKKQREHEELNPNSRASRSIMYQPLWNSFSDFVTDTEPIAALIHRLLRFLTASLELIKHFYHMGRLLCVFSVSHQCTIPRVHINTPTKKHNTEENEGKETKQ